MTSSRRAHPAALVLLGGVSVACGGFQPAALDTRVLVETLASDAFEGRLTGSEGIQRAADYIIEQLEAIGAEPLPGQTDFRRSFAFTAGVRDAGTTLTVEPAGGEAKQQLNGNAIRALAFSDNGSAEGPLVFAGYGLSVPETGGFSYDSYVTLDVADKIVLVLRYFPEDSEGEVRATLSRYAGLRYKAFAARERGAKGLIVVTGPRSPNAGELVPMMFDTTIGGSGIVAATVTGEVGEALITRAGRTFTEVQRSLDTANPHATGFEIPVRVTLDAAVDQEERAGYNVVGYLPPRDIVDIAKPYVMLGAHYDHLGLGGSGNSLAREDEAGEIHNGADDNASGVAAILSAGAQLARIDRQRGIILAFWSGEELGLLGSAAFVEQAPVPVDQIAAYLNFDMVGRLRENKLTVQAVGTSSIWTDLVDELNATFEFELQFISDPYLRTDVMSLNAAEVPSLAFFTGSHEDYHRPTDDADTVNYPDLDRIAELGAAVVARLATRDEPPDFIRAKQTVQRVGQTSLRIFTGTIPNYTEEAKGLLLAGAIAGGPAERAGLQEGDVIVELASQAITNIYDYTYALDVLKVGEPASVVFLRGGKRMETEIVPEARR